MIIFDENKYVEEVMFKDDFDLNSSIIKKLGILAKYYIYKGVIRDDIPSLLEEFLIKHNMEYCPMDIYIKKAMLIADKYELSYNRKIHITENELKFIKGFNNNTIERIVFVMIVMNKFLGHSVKLNPHDIQKYTKQNLNYDNFYKYYKLIKDNKNVIVYKNEFRFKHDTESPTVLTISDFENMIIEYLKTCKTREYIYCERCGVKVKNSLTKPNKYCSNCAKLIKNIQTNISKKRKNAEKSKSL